MFKKKILSLSLSLLQLLSISYFITILEVQCTEFEYIDVKVQFNEAVADCEARGKILAIIDTPEKFNIVYDLLTNNGRYELIYIRGRGINDNYFKNSKYLSFNFFFYIFKLNSSSKEGGIL